MCRALLCSDDSSHSQSQSGKRLLLASRGHPARTPAYQGSCIDPTHLSHPLDPTPQAPRSRNPLTIQLLIKDFQMATLCMLYMRLKSNIIDTLPFKSISPGEHRNVFFYILAKWIFICYFFVDCYQH